jgi:hypothetical protein
MKHKGLLAVLAACAGIAFPGLPIPGVGDLGVSKAYADGGRRVKPGTGWKRAARMRGYYYGGGYYSYTDREVVSSWAWARSLFISRSYFRTPLTSQQSPGGPFDSGFFFDSGLSPHWWNNAPYPN